MQEEHLEAIAKAITDWYKLPSDALHGDRVVGAAAEARRAYVVLANELGAPFSVIADWLGVERSSASRMSKAVMAGDTSPSVQRVTECRSHVHTTLAAAGLGIICPTCGGSGRILHQA